MATPLVSAVGAASGAPSAAAAGAPSRIQEYIAQVLQTAKGPEISWHLVLENHACPPAIFGEPLCASLTACKQFGRLGSAHRCRLVLPNSYAHDDGKVVGADAVALDKHTADERACCAVFALLCVCRPRWSASCNLSPWPLARVNELFD